MITFRAVVRVVVGVDAVVGACLSGRHQQPMRLIILIGLMITRPAMAK